MDAYDREEEALCEAFNRGDIDRKTFDREMRELRYAARADAEEAADRAREQVMEYYGFGRW